MNVAVAESRCNHSGEHDEPNEKRVTGLADPSRWQLEGEGRTRTRGADVVIETTVHDQRLSLVPSG